MKDVGKIKSNKGFYIGDISDVLNSYLCDIVWGDKYNYEDGLLDFPNGYQVLVCETACGVLGIVPEELIDWDKVNKDYGDISEVGTYVEGITAETLYDKNKFTITIHTGTETKSLDIHMSEYDEEEDYSYYEDQLQEIYEATLIFAQEAKAVGFDKQAKQLDNVLDMLDHINFNKI